MASASVMNLPCLVLPYQWSPSRWKTFVSVLTQTIPLTGGCWGVPAADSAVFEDVDEAVIFELDEEELVDFEVSVAGAAGADAAGFAGGAASATAAFPETVTMPPILSIVDLFTPARDRSDTDEYGRPAMIFFAVAGPTPGRSSSSFCEAVFRSTFAPIAAAGAAFSVFSAFSVFAGADFEAVEAVEADEDIEDVEADEPPPETVTCFSIFEMVFAGTPAFSRSETDL